jgi:putative addiction module CopG family antidote
MQISLKQPELERFIEEQVKAGIYPSADALIEAAVADFQAASEEPLNAHVLAAINEGVGQAKREEGIDLEAFREQISRRGPRS